MTDEERIATWTMRLRTEIPNVAAVVLKGSHAQDAPGPYSDIDFDVLVDREPYETYLTFFEEDGEGCLRHISVAVQNVVGWMAAQREPVSWSYGLPAAESTRLLWAREIHIRAQLDRPVRMRPPQDPELEDFIEGWSKIRNARAREDEIAVRLAAHALGALAPTLLRCLNPDIRPASPYQALQIVLSFPVAPEGYRRDLERCLGLSGDARSIIDVYAAAERLTFGVVSMLRENADTFEGVLPGDLHAYLTDGTLDRYIRQ